MISIFYLTKSILKIGKIENAGSRPFTDMELKKSTRPENTFIHSYKKDLIT